MEKNEIGFGKQITLLMVGISLLVLLCAVSIAAVNIKSSLTSSAEQKIGEITELAYNIIDGYKKRVDSGELTEAQAKALALKDFDSFKYQGKNYVWVMKYDYKYLYHPSRPVDFDGSSLKDNKGNHYIKELADNAIKGEQIFIKNYTPKPGDPSKKPYPKISVGKAYPAWGWIVATGIYIDEIDNMVNRTLMYMCFAIVIAVLLIVVIANHGLIRKIVEKMNIMSGALRKASNLVSDTSYSLETASQGLAEGSSEQASAIQETSATIEETASMVRQNNENTKHAATLAKNTKEYTKESSKSTQKMMTTMGELEHSSHEISKIIKAIDDIAFQTNILSLNAAVEAARAGDAGKGFAVVAEEVRTLAQRSAQAAKDTESIIQGNISLSKQGFDMAKEVELSLSKIDTEVQKVNDLLDEISTATNEQAQGVDQINKAISQMEIVLQTNADTAGTTSSASQDLTEQVASLNEIVDNLYRIVNGTRN